ncbi:MAG: hypothetical protein M2R45_04254 [Verrucomicrobia subdivision 3 bacterium]|nr:hypothetical protein [Limisphaerales bacterium]MCS1412620.1 hypothetical protein [Limisphaerales bacterium]
MGGVVFIQDYRKAGAVDQRRTQTSRCVFINRTNAVQTVAETPAEVADDRSLTGKQFNDGEIRGELEGGAVDEPEPG